VAALLSAGAPVESRNGNGHTPLIAASARGHAHVITQLGAAGARFDAVGAKDLTCGLHFAAIYKHEEAVRSLLRGGGTIDLQKTDDGLSALLFAVYLGHAAMTTLLIEASASLELANKRGSTALLLASDGGKTQIVRELIKAGGDVNAADADDNTPLILARKGQHEEIVQALLDAGARDDAPPPTTPPPHDNPHSTSSPPGGESDPPDADGEESSSESAPAPAASASATAAATAPSSSAAEHHSKEPKASEKGHSRSKMSSAMQSRVDSGPTDSSTVLQ
jgi:ankyrin repeat protein